MPDNTLTRRKFLELSATASPALLLSCSRRAVAAATFTILHTNDMHSNLIGVGPASEYTPTTLNDDATIGGIARISSLIAERKRLREADGPVLILDAGDYSIGTAFGGATQKLGAELRCLARAGYDATTFGNHEFDIGPGGLAQAVAAAHAAGEVPAILVANTDVDDDVDGLKDLATAGVIRKQMIIDRAGIRFGVFGIMGPDAIQYTINPGAVRFPDPFETAREMATQLRKDGADVVICISHGGVKEPSQGPIVEGDDVSLAQAVPEIDVIVGGHTHSFLQKAAVANGTPIVQAGCYGQAVGEVVLRMDERGTQVVSNTLHRVDDAISGDPHLIEQVGTFTAAASAIVFEPRGLSSDEPLAVIDRDWPNDFADLEASRPIGNLTADAIRAATGADVSLNAAGMVRAGLVRGSTGVQTAYDVFLLAPLGIGVEDHSAGGSLVVAYLSGHEIKSCLEFLLVGNPNLPGQYFPRVSGIRFRYDPSRPTFDVVTEIEVGDIDQGYRRIDATEDADELFSVGCNLYFGLILKSIPEYTNGLLALEPKTRDGAPLSSRVDALPTRQTGAYLLPPRGTVNAQEVVRDEGTPSAMEIKEWQAIMDHVKGMPTKNEQGVTLLRLDERSMEDRSIDTSV